MTEPLSRRSLLDAQIRGGKQVARVDVQEVTMAAGVKAPLHLHPCPTVGVVTAGRFVYQREGEESQRLEPGDAFFEPADARVVRFDNDGDEPATFVVFYLLGEGETETARVLED